MSDAAESLPTRDRRIANLIPFRPGQSGNPSGTNAITGMMRRIREATNNGQELFDILLEFARDETESRVVRMKAVDMLLDRAFGKPKEQKDTQEQPSILNIANLPPEKFEALIALLREASGKASGESSNQVI